MTDKEIDQMPTSIVTRNTTDLADKGTGNAYEGLVIIARRAQQLALKQKQELNNKLLDFSTGVDTLEEVFENREQIEISKQYERQPKPTIVAMEEFLKGKIDYKYPETEDGHERITF